MLLAEIQGELSIDEARVVHLHLRTCERCSARLEQLRNAYEQVASLSDVPHVPLADVRETVLRDSQGKLRAIRMTRGLNLSGRGMLLGVVALVSAIIILLVAVVRPIVQTRFLSTQRSQNAIAHPAPVGTGIFYAETVKLIPVTINGAQWYLGEVIALDEHSGRVVQSMPASMSTLILPDLGISAGTNVRPALSADGKTLVEAAIVADGRSPTAFAAIDTLTGKVRYVHTLALPAGADQQSDPFIHRLWLSADGSTIFVLTDLAVSGQRSPRLLAFNAATGAQSPSVVPPLDDTNAGAALGTASQTIITNTTLYSATVATDSKGRAGVNVAFINIATRRTDATLFIPGDFRLFGLAITPDGAQLCLFNGQSDTVYFIATKSRTVLNAVDLGNPGTPPPAGAPLASGETLSLSVSNDGKHLFIALDAIADTPRNFELYDVSIDQQSFVSVTQLPQPIGSITLSSDGSNIILLRNGGKLEWLSAANPKLPAPWVTLSDNAQIIQLAGGNAAPAK